MSNENRALGPSGLTLTIKVYYDNAGVMTLRGSETSLPESPSGSGVYSADLISGQVATDSVILLKDGVPFTGADFIPEVTVDLSPVTAKTDLLPADPASETNVDANETKLDSVLANQTSISNDISALNDVSSSEIVTAIKAMTGITAGGTWTFDTLLKIMASYISGKVEDKIEGDDSVQNVLDADDGVTVIAEIAHSRTSPYREVTIL